MSKFNALDILQMCIDELNSTTKEQFDEKRKTLGIYNKTYNPEEYYNEEFEILFNLDEVVNMYGNNYNSVCEVEEVNLLQLEYDKQDMYYNDNTANQRLFDIAIDITNINCKSYDTFALAS